MRQETQDQLRKYGIDEVGFEQALRELFPHGHPDFLPTTLAEMELHSVKNHDYASGGSALWNFERAAAILALYPGLKLSDKRVYALVLALKQIDAVLWGLSNSIEHKVEGLNSRLQDISVYAKIVMCMNIEAARNVEIDRQFGVDLHTKTDKSLYAQGAQAGCSRVEVSAQG